MAKILALVSFKIFPPHMGGQKHVVHFYEALAKHHDIYMLASRDNTEKIEATFLVETLLFPNKRMFLNYGLLNTIARIIEREKINCIIAEHSYTGWLALLIKKKTGLPFIIHSHNLEVFRFRQMKKKGWRLYRPYEEWIHRKADHSFFISREDMETAVAQFNLDAGKCSVSTYGIARPARIENAKETVREKFGIVNRHVLHFNGTMDYEPNIDAVNYILQEIGPKLKKVPVNHVILISGKRLPPEIIEKIKATSNIRYLDFVEDINELYQGVDIFLNPVTNDSGIKTKVVEALANDCTVVSTHSGASGIPEDCYRGKLFKVPDDDWDAFCIEVVSNLKNSNSTPEKFFDYFAWKNIAIESAETINEVVKNAGKS